MKYFIILLFIYILITNGNIYKFIHNNFLKNNIKYKKELEEIICLSIFHRIYERKYKINDFVLLKKKDIINYIINFEKNLIFNSSIINILDIAILF